MIFDTLIYFAAINMACAGFDGAAFLEARKFPDPDGGNPIIMPETGPVAILTGPYPTFESFLLAGLAEVIILSAVSYGLKRAGLKRYWSVPQITVSGIHLGLGIANIYTHHKWMHYGRERGYIK